MSPSRTRASTSKGCECSALWRPAWSSFSRISGKPSALSRASQPARSMPAPRKWGRPLFFLLFCLCASLFGRRLQAQQAGRVAEVDLAPVAGLERHAVQRLDRLAGEERPAFGVERTIGAEQHVLHAEEVEAAADGAPRAVHRGIAVEHPEEVEGALLHALEQPLVVLVARAGAELVHAVADPVDEKRRHGAE